MRAIIIFAKCNQYAEEFDFLRYKENFRKYKTNKEDCIYFVGAFTDPSDYQKQFELVHQELNNNNFSELRFCVHQSDLEILLWEKRLHPKQNVKKFTKKDGAGLEMSYEKFYIDLPILCFEHSNKNHEIPLNIFDEHWKRLECIELGHDSLHPFKKSDSDKIRAYLESI